MKMLSGMFGKSILLKCRLLSNFLFIFLTAAVAIFICLPAVAVAQEKPDSVGVTQEEKDKYKELKKAVREEKIEEAVQEDQTGNDPRAFSNKWMPFYRYTELENGLIQHDVTAFGSIVFGKVVAGKGVVDAIRDTPTTRKGRFSDVPAEPVVIQIVSRLSDEKARDRIDAEKKKSADGESSS